MNKTFILLITIFLLLTACNKDDGTTSSDFTITSIAIKNGELLDEYKCEQKVNGVENSIPLSWSNVPAEAKSLAITMHHYPNPDDTTHVNSYLLLWNIAPSVTGIAYAQANKGDWYMGSNKDGNAISYTSPCSAGGGTHEYIITIYALSETPPSLPKESSIDVTYNVMMEALSTVTIIDKAVLKFISVN